MSSRAGSARESCSTAMTRRAPDARSARVRPPGPGPISTMTASSSGAAARAIFAVRLRSSRKFWPSDLRAERPCSRITSRSGGRSSIALIPLFYRHTRGEPQGRNQACRVGAAGARDVEGRAVIWRGANERQTQRDVHGLVERQRLDRDEGLVVIHADRTVIGLAGRLVKQGVGGQGTFDVDIALAQEVDGRRDDGL